MYSGNELLIFLIFQRGCDSRMNNVAIRDSTGDTERVRNSPFAIWEDRNSMMECPQVMTGIQIGNLVSDQDHPSLNLGCVGFASPRTWLCGS